MGKGGRKDYVSQMSLSGVQEMPILLYPVGVDVLEFGLSLQLQLYFVYASCRGSGKSVHIVTLPAKVKNIFQRKK